MANGLLSLGFLLSFLKVLNKKTLLSLFRYMINCVNLRSGKFFHKENKYRITIQLSSWKLPLIHYNFTIHEFTNGGARNLQTINYIKQEDA